jgi:hypothetical protein
MRRQSGPQSATTLHIRSSLLQPARVVTEYLPASSSVPKRILSSLQVPSADLPREPAVRKARLSATLVDEPVFEQLYPLHKLQ